MPCAARAVVRAVWWCQAVFHVVRPCSPARGCFNPSSLVSTFYYILELRALSRFAARLGYDDESAQFADMAARTATLAHTSWYNATTGLYYHGEQTDQVLALVLGLPSSTERTKVVAALLDRVESADGHLTSGV